MVSIKKLNNPESSDSTLGEIKMATRIGKYKISKRESALNLTDGGTVEGSVKSNYLRLCLIKKFWKIRLI